MKFSIFPDPYLVIITTYPIIRHIPLGIADYFKEIMYFNFITYSYGKSQETLVGGSEFTILVNLPLVIITIYSGLYSRVKEKSLK